jgi:2-keto-4-pentenoate hydratase
MQNLTSATIMTSLYRARRDHHEPTELEKVFLNLEEGLSAQIAVLREFEKAGESLGGWKVGLTSGINRDAMGKDFRPFGFVLNTRVIATGGMIARSELFRPQLEPELCLVVGTPLRGHVTREQARAAVRAVQPAFEVNEIRVPSTWSNGLRVADGLANWGIVLGPEAAPRDSLNEVTVHLYRGAERVATSNLGPAMDDPYLSLARLCHVLDKQGLGLEPGQPVITGAFCHLPVLQADFFRAVFEGIGEVSIEITER